MNVETAESTEGGEEVVNSGSSGTDEEKRADVAGAGVGASVTAGGTTKAEEEGQGGQDEDDDAFPSLSLGLLGSTLDTAGNISPSRLGGRDSVLLRAPTRSRRSIMQHNVGSSMRKSIRPQRGGLLVLSTQVPSASHHPPPAPG